MCLSCTPAAYSCIILTRSCLNCAKRVCSAELRMLIRVSPQSSFGYSLYDGSRLNAARSYNLRNVAMQVKLNDLLWTYASNTGCILKQSKIKLKLIYFKCFSGFFAWFGYRYFYLSLFEVKCRVKFSHVCFRCPWVCFHMLLGVGRSQ